MKYDSLSRNTVKITLSEEDMREYSLCAESIALRTAQTKRSLARLLEEMNLFAGYKPERLFLEAFPKREGGCVLYVSSLGEDFDLPPKDDVPRLYMCMTDKLDTVIKICQGLKQLADNPSASVYLWGGKYAAVVSAFPESSEKIHHFLAEYGNVSHDTAEISLLPEYGTAICINNACEELTRLA